MNLSQRNRNIILWIVAIGLLVSMVISFTPGTLFGNRQPEEPAALLVNGQPVTELEVARLEQNPPFNAVQEGPLAEDLELVLLDELVRQSVLRQAAAGVDVSSAEVRARVNEFREQQGVAGAANDRAYQSLIAGAGYTDETFRELVREQLRSEKYLESLVADVTVSDEEVQAYFAANREVYSTEPRITAREIVVADRALADELYARALGGEDFAALAREYSTERAEQGGALGAADGGAPQPVGAVALPTAVSQAAFGLQGPGLTEPVEAGGAFHIVKVESYQPATPRPFEEVAEEVRADALEIKQAGVQEAALEELRASAEVTVPETSRYAFENPVVARVGDYQISAAELNRNTYLDPQIQQLINPNFAQIILESVKPSVLEGLIDRELAVQGGAGLGVPLIGSRAARAQNALGYVSRDAEATDAQVQRYYQENRETFTESARATVTRVSFSEQAAARRFREALLGQPRVDAAVIGAAVGAAGGTQEELGVVTPGSQPPELDAALFEADALSALPGPSDLSVSRVVRLEAPAPATGGAATGGAATGGAMTGGAAVTQPQFVVLLATLTPERVRPLAEVRPLVQQAVLREERSSLQQAWLAEQRETLEVENLLASVAPAPAIGTGGAATGGAPVPEAQRAPTTEAAQPAVPEPAAPAGPASTEPIPAPAPDPAPEPTPDAPAPAEPNPAPQDQSQ